MAVEDVGVVVIGRNEGERLIDCLNSVKAFAQQIIYVDSGSTDGSVESAAKIGACAVRLDLSLPFTAARARNEGFLALKSLRPDVRFVHFIDGDCSLVPGWLETARAFIEKRNDVAVVCGRRRERRPAASIYNQFCDIEWNTPIGEAFACGGDALARVEAFEPVGGFCSKLIAGEEPELCLRLREKGWKIWRLDADMTEHDAAMTRFRQWWARTVRCGYGYAEVSWMYPKSPSGVWRRETLRAVVWGGLLPATIALGGLVHPFALLGASVYFLQMCRMAIKAGPTLRWERALFSILAKFAEFQGILKFLWRRWLRRTSTLIEYK